MAHATVKLDLEGLAQHQKEFGLRFFGVVQRGFISGALRALPILQSATRNAPAANPGGQGGGGAVNTGAYLRSWKSEALKPIGVRIFNDAPYSGVIELGRRPGHPPPIAPILAWARRCLGLSEAEAKGAAFAIARAIGRQGLRARGVMVGSLPAITMAVLAEVRDVMDEELFNG